MKFTLSHNNVMVVSPSDSSTVNFTNFKPEHCIALMVMFSSYMIVQLQKNDESSEESLNDDTLDCDDAQTVN